MIKVKEILNYQEAQEHKINTWLEANPHIELIDIKYSVGCFQDDEQEFSGALIIYKED